MTFREYRLSAERLEENLWILTDGKGNVPAHNKAISNVSFALRAMLETLFELEVKSERIERKTLAAHTSTRSVRASRRSKNQNL